MLRLRILLGLVIVVFFFLAASGISEASDDTAKIIESEVTNKATITLFDITSAELICAEIGFDLFSIRFVSDDNYTVVCSSVETGMDAYIQGAKLRSFFKEKVAPKIMKKAETEYKYL